MISERAIRYDSSAGRLTTPEYEWEKWFGHAGNRTKRLGKHALSFRRYYGDVLEKQREEIRSAHQAKRSAQEQRRDEERESSRIAAKRAEHVAEMGQQAFRLRGIVPKNSLQRTFQKALYRHASKFESFARYLREQEDVESLASGLEGADGEDENESDDEDWDTTNWSKVELEGAVDMLIAEVRQSAQLKRRRVATSMLVQLLRKHKIALDYLDLIVPSLVEKGLFATHSGARRGVDAIRLGHLLAAIAHFIPEKMSHYACAKKSAFLLARKFHLAAQIIQAKYRTYRFEKTLAREVDIHVRVRRRGMNIMLMSDLLKQWNRLYHEKIGELSLEEVLSQMKLLEALCSERNKDFFKKDRRVIVEQGGLYPIQELCLSPSQDVRTSALNLLALVASHPALQLQLLQCGVHITLSILLQSELIEDRCLALEVVDILANSVSFKEPKVLHNAWKLVHTKELTEMEIVKQSGRFGVLFNEEAKLSVFARSLDPTLKVADCAKLLVDRRRDGGLLRWVKLLLKSEDGVVRLGATMSLLKLASSCCNPYIVCIKEKLTFPERMLEESICSNHEGNEEGTRLEQCSIPFKPMTPAIQRREGKSQESYEARRRARVKHLVHSLIYNLADLTVPGLSILTLQLFAQLCSCQESREVLLEVDLPDLILMNLCSESCLNKKEGVDNGFGAGATIKQLRLRGIMVLVFLACHAEFPNPVQLGATSTSKDSSSLLQRPYQDVLNLDIFCEESDLEKCFQSTMLAMASQTPERYVMESCEKLLFRYRGISSLFTYLFQDCDGWKTPMEGNIVENLEHRCVLALVLAKFCNVGDTLVPSLCTENVLETLCATIKVSSQMKQQEQKLAAIPQSVVDLVKASTSSSCFALAMIARCQEYHTARWKVASFLSRHNIIPMLGSLVSQGSQGSRDGKKSNHLNQLDVDIAIAGANLLGSLVPWLGFEFESTTDMISETNVPDVDDEDVGQRKLLTREQLVRLRGSENARKAAEQGLEIVMHDQKSRFNDDQFAVLIRETIDTIGNQLLQSLQKVIQASKENLEELNDSLYYCIGRFANTLGMSLRLLNLGAINIAKHVVPAKKAKNYENLLGMISPAFFSFCANIGRTIDGKFQLIVNGVLRHAVETLAYVEVSNQNSMLLGEAALVVARLANVYHPVHGAANGEILHSHYSCLVPLLKIGREETFPPRARLHALVAIAQLAQDGLQTVPVLVKVNGLNVMVKILRTLEDKFDNTFYGEALLRQTLRILQAVARFMVGEYHDQLLELGVEPVLQRLSVKGVKEDQVGVNGNGDDVIFTVGQLAQSVLSDLRLTISYGSQRGRQIATAPVENDRPLTSGLDDSQFYKRDLNDYTSDPFQAKGKREPVHYPDSGEVKLPPCTAKGRIETDRNVRTRRKPYRKRKSNTPSLLPRPVAEMPKVNSEVSFTDTVTVATAKPNQLLWTRPKGKPKVSKHELDEMHQAFLLSTRPSKPN